MLLDLPVYKQGELDFACGLYCLISVAEHFGVEMKDINAPLSNLIGRREEGLRAKGPWKSRVMPLVWGIGVDAMATLARELGLECSILEPPGDLDALKSSYLSVTLVMCEFNHPMGFYPSYEDSHYLVVQSDGAMLHVADTHPWMPHVRPVNDMLFHTMWNDERLEFPGWALTFPVKQPRSDLQDF